MPRVKKDIADYEMLKKKYGYLVNQTDWTAKSTSSIPKKYGYAGFKVRRMHQIL